MPNVMKRCCTRVLVESASSEARFALYAGTDRGKTFAVRRKQTSEGVRVLASTSVPDRTTTLHVCAGLDATHTVRGAEHPYHGDDQLLLGNMGMAGGGGERFARHSNIQGLTV